jgi:hypothetical protein
MSRLLLRLAVLLIAAAPGLLGIYLVAGGYSTVDTPHRTFVLMGVPLLVLSAALLGFAGLTLFKDRRSPRGPAR